MSEEAVTAPALPTFTPEEKVCGNCKLWSAHSTDHRGWVGPCRLQAQRGLFPPSAPICDAFVAKGSAAPAQRNDADRTRVRNVVKNIAPTVVRKARDPNEQIDLGGEAMTRQELMEIFREAVADRDVAEAPPLAGKWEGGVIQIIPGKSDLQAKELPVDALFHKIVMARDRLRTLEQKINGHPKLTDAEKVEMQSYITRIYGSLTTFNALFRDKEDFFVGQKSDE